MKEATAAEAEALAVASAEIRTMEQARVPMVGITPRAAAAAATMLGVKSFPPGLDCL
jgi:hypothetical protein